MSQPLTLTTPGEFFIGANYWASHAGTHMWADWRADVVEQDFKRLSDAGIQVLRVFPLWPDFQPINLLRTSNGYPVEYRFGEEPLPDDECGQAGMSAEAMAHFGEFLDLAEKYNLKLIVGLLTGWMSGRLHVPAPLESVNVLTDPLAIMWELRFIKYFVGTFKHHAAIAGWDLGNECNCMARCTREEAYAWTATISNAIRVADSSRPVVSGLHSLSPVGNWRMQDQAELTDLLTVHPYVVFTQYCDQDPLNTIRSIMQSTAEARFYADIGGKPCLCQEIGTLGPALASDAIAADFIKSCLYSLWANDCHGLIWWCANEQIELTHAPYDWDAVERELGFFRIDGTPKPIAGVMGDFRRILESLPFERLPQRQREAVCILTTSQDHWGVAYSSMILAKQAGFDIEFQYQDQPIKDAPFYLLPCLAGHSMISRRRLFELLEKVAAGATLYMSLDSGLPTLFEPITGMEPQTRERRRDFGTIQLDAIMGTPRIPCGGDFKIRMKPTRAEVLAREEDGSPIWSVAQYGKGKVYLLGMPLEMILTRTPGVFHADDAPFYWRIYTHMATELLANRAVGKTHPMIAITEHPSSDTERIIIAINQSPTTIQEGMSLQDRWKLTTIHHGQIVDDGDRCLDVVLPPHDALIFTVKI